jgi:hypothetical protein
MTSSKLICREREDQALGARKRGLGEEKPRRSVGEKGSDFDIPTFSAIRVPISGIGKRIHAAWYLFHLNPAS